MLCSTYILIGMLLIVGFDTFVEQWIQAYEKQHVDNQQRNYPYNNDNNDFDDGGVAVLVFAFATWTKLLFLSLDFITYSG